MKPGLKCDVVVLRVALVCLALVGCGGGTADSGTPSGSEPLPESAPPAAQAVPDSESADSALAAEGWETVANQYQTFTLDKPSTVRFGLGDTWVTRELAAGRVYCFFDPDPAPGKFKTCQRSTQPAPVSEPALSPACASFYAPDFALTSTRQASPIPTVAKPAKGVAVSEPTYKTCVVRATDHTADGVSGFARNDYSRRQAFNANSTKQLVAALDGYWHVYDANTHVRLKQLSGPGGDAEPQWHPTNPDLLYYLPTVGIGMKLHELNVSTGASRVVGDFGARLKARWPAAMAAWTKSEGSPSANGRYWCFMVDANDWISAGVFTWDRDTDTILGTYDTQGERPDHVSMSPSGNHCVVSGDGARGTVAFSRDFSTKTQLLATSQHSDLALDANGDDVYVAIDYGSNAGDVFMVNLRTGVRTALFSTYLSGTATALHVSGKAFARPGWVVVSTYSDGGGSLQWLHRKVMAVQLKANPTVYTLAHHRSTPNGYWTTPVASVNRDFTRVVFNSNWGSGSDTDVDTYVVEIPAGALK